MTKAEKSTRTGATRTTGGNAVMTPATRRRSAGQTGNADRAGYDPAIHGPLGISPEDWSEVADNPPLSNEELASAGPFAEVFPAIAEKMRRGPGRPPLETPKRQVTIRLDDEVVQAFQREGKGWQARINAALRKAVGL